MELSQAKQGTESSGEIRLVVCKQCSKEFQWVKNRKYCGPECSKVARGIGMKAYLKAHFADGKLKPVKRAPTPKWVNPNGKTGRAYGGYLWGESSVE